jgi:MFS family permease
VKAAPLAGLVTAHVISLTGNMLTVIALPLYVLSATGSAAATGLAGFFATLPVVVGGSFGGVLVDRFGYRRSSIVADLVSSVTIAAVPLLDRTVGLPFWVLLTLVFTSGLLDTPGQTARDALLPEVASAAGVPLERAVGWFEASERSARLIGAPLAGLLVAAFGALNVLVFDALTFLVSAALVAGVVRTGRVTSPAPADPAAPEAVSGYWSELIAGFRFIAGDRLLRAVVLLVVVTNMFDAAKYTVLLPVYADRHLGGAVAFGLLVGAMSGGAMSGSLLYGLLGPRLPRRLTFAVAFVLAGGPVYFAYVAGVPLAGLLVLTALSGFCAGALNPIIGVLKLERVPAGMRARVYGLMNAGCWAAMPVGSLLAGLAVEHISLRTTLIAVGTGYLLVTLIPSLGGPWREMDRVRQTQPSEPFEPAEFATERGA